MWIFDFYYKSRASCKGYERGVLEVIDRSDMPLKRETRVITAGPQPLAGAFTFRLS